MQCASTKRAWRVRLVSLGPLSIQRLHELLQRLRAPIAVDVYLGRQMLDVALKAALP